MNDLIADSIIRLKNGGMRGLEKVSLLNSKMIREILRILLEEGYIEKYEIIDTRNLDVYLRYYKGEAVLKNIRRISKCSRRIYSGISNLPRLRSNFGIFILSTNKGLMTNVKAKKENVGGEILVEIF